MAPMPNNKNANINKLFGKIDNINSKEQYDRLHVPINIKDENGDSILHHILIHALDEEQALMKIKSIDKIETLINTTNKKGQTPMHLICKYQYYDTFNYIVDKCENKKGTVGPEDFKLVVGNIDIEGGAKDEEIKINYIAFDNKRKTPFNYLLHGVLHNKSNDKTNVLNEFTTKDLIKKTNIKSFNLLKKRYIQMSFDNNDINIRFINDDFIKKYIEKIGKKMYLLMNTYVDNRQLKQFIVKDGNSYTFKNNTYQNIEDIINHLFYVNISNIYDLRYFIYTKKLRQLIPKNNSQNAMKLISLLLYMPKDCLQFLYSDIKCLLTLHEDDINKLLSINPLNFTESTLLYSNQLEYIQTVLNYNYLRQYLNNDPKKYKDIIGTFDKNTKNKLLRITNILNDDIVKKYKEFFNNNVDFIQCLNYINTINIPEKYLILLRLDTDVLNDIKTNIGNIKEIEKEIVDKDTVKKEEYKKIVNYFTDISEQYANSLLTILKDLHNDLLNRDDILTKLIELQNCIKRLIFQNKPLFNLDNYEQLYYLYELLHLYITKQHIDNFIYNRQIDISIRNNYLYCYLSFGPVILKNIENIELKELYSNKLIKINDNITSKYINYTDDTLYNNNEAYKDKSFYINDTTTADAKIKSIDIIPIIVNGNKYNMCFNDKFNVYLKSYEYDNIENIRSSNKTSYYLNNIKIDGENLLYTGCYPNILINSCISTCDYVNLNSDKITLTKDIKNLYFDTTIDQYIYLGHYRIHITNNNIHVYIDDLDQNNKNYIDIYNNTLVTFDKKNNPIIHELEDGVNTDNYNVVKTTDDVKIIRTCESNKDDTKKISAFIEYINNFILDINQSEITVDNITGINNLSNGLTNDYNNDKTQIITNINNDMSLKGTDNNLNKFISNIKNSNLIFMLVNYLLRYCQGNYNLGLTVYIKNDLANNQIIFNTYYEDYNVKFTFNYNTNKLLMDISKSYDTTNNNGINTIYFATKQSDSNNFYKYKIKYSNPNYGIHYQIFEDTDVILGDVLYNTTEINITNNNDTINLSKSGDNVIIKQTKKDGKNSEVKIITIDFTNYNLKFDSLSKYKGLLQNCTDCLLVYDSKNLHIKKFEDYTQINEDVKKIYLYAYLLTLNKLGIHNNYINHEYFNSISTIFDDINDVVTNNLMKTYEDIKLKLLQKFQSEKIDKIII